jgi:hypothetical protein
MVITAGSFIDIAKGASSIAGAFQRSITTENITPGRKFEALNHNALPRKRPKSKSSLDLWLAQGGDRAKEHVVRKNPCAELKVHPFLSNRENKRKAVDEHSLSEHDIDPGRLEGIT